MKPTASKTVVFIHGLFMNPKSWAPWVTYFQSLGYTCHTPAYPHHEGIPANLRQNPPAELDHLSFEAVVSHLEGFLSTLSKPAILIGHSMGGLVVQKLLEKGKAAAAVAIDTAPPAGLFSTRWSFLKANFSTINPLKGDSVCLPTVGWFHYAFCNVMTLAETQKAYDEFLVPESRNIPRTSTGNQGKIDFKKPHGPLLFIAGEKDNIIPAGLNKKNFLAYCDPTSIRELRVFPGRSHWICSQQGWEEVAGFVSQWIGKL